MKTKFLALMLLLFTAGFSQAQTYKIGDTHPCGGIVFSVNDAGTAGFIVSPNDVGKFTFAECNQKVAAALGEGWGMPSKNQLNEIYLNLHKRGIGNFKNEMYRTGTPSGYPHYPWGQNFANGKQEGCSLNNLALCRGVKAFPCEVKTQNTLSSGQTLHAGERLTSANGAYILRMQKDDGNLCIYRYSNNQQGPFVWGSMKYGFKNAKLVMQTDGNLVVYDGAGVAKWASNTHPYNNPKFKDPAMKPVKCVLENDGKLKLYNAAGTVVWTN